VILFPFQYQGIETDIYGYRSQYLDGQGIETDSHIKVLRPYRSQYLDVVTEKMIPIDCVAILVQARGILPRPEEQSRTCGCQSGSVEDQPQCPGM
jgi:hypothetical protein